MKYLKYVCIFTAIVLIVCVLSFKKVYKTEDIKETNPIINNDNSKIEEIIEKQDEVTEITVEKEEVTESKTKTESNNNTPIKEETPQVNEDEVKEEPKEETNPTTSPSNEVTPEVDDTVVDTSALLYSIHLGRVDTDTQANCLSMGETIALNNVIDVLYFNCIEVTSTTNKSLGYYLDIICESGNCEKYK